LGCFRARCGGPIADTKRERHGIHAKADANPSETRSRRNESLGRET
jgi:hypothetical protein